MKNTNTIAVDLAKSVFQICILSANNKVTKHLRLNRAKFKEFLLTTNASTVYMEACYSAHYWGRFAEQAGHTVGLIPAQHVTPFVRGNKNDRNDALAIAEASRRPGIKFVQVKSEAQQDIQALHRIRERCVAARTALMNQMRGLLSDYGHVFPVGINAFLTELKSIDFSEVMSEIIQREISRTLMEYDFLTRRIEHIQKELTSYANKNAECQRLQSIPGIGPHIASAIVSSIGKGNSFESARCFAVWTGLTPIQKASGFKSVMSGITKRGDGYIRKLLVQAARHTVLWAKRNPDTKLGHWINQIMQRRGMQKGTVAVAHKLARISWILLQREQEFKVL